MGAYASWFLPRLLDFAMRNRVLEPYRRATVGAARGVVLEIGVGSGLNLPLYDPAVDRVIALDPSSELLGMARERAADAVVPVSLLRAAAERIPFTDEFFDTIVMTWTLCSIPRPAMALAEMRRVLKPGGRLLFVEHGLSPDPRVALWQRRITPCWSHIGGGCHLDRDTAALLGAAGFRVDALDTGYLKGPKPWTFIYRGSAAGE